MQKEHKVLCGNLLYTDVVVDGESLPMLELEILCGLNRRSWIFLNKKQTENLIEDLQQRLKEIKE